jgi:diguanylate cyclase (GGDEF)-like protein
MLEALTEAEAMLPEIPEVADLPTGTWDPHALGHGAIGDMPTAAWDIPGSGGQSQEVPAAPPAAGADVTTSIGPAINALLNADLSGTVAYIDFNCPYCFALHERITKWGLARRIEWCMVEHASHVLDGPFDIDQEQMLSSEVLEVHHRAPDIELVLPAQRCRSTMATRLIVLVERESPDAVQGLREDLYRALWQEGTDIGDAEVLAGMLEAHGLSPALLSQCDEEPPELTAWQADWDNGDFDHSIPVLTHPASGRVLIGLPDERTLTEFLLSQRTRIVDSSVCYYQRKPSILVCGWMRHMWPLLADIRGCCEVIQAATPARAEELLSERAVPDLVILEGEHIDQTTMEHLAKLARGRSVPWIVATRAPSSEAEVSVLSMGAVEYLPITDDSAVARARLGRILRDRYNLERITADAKTDPLTHLPSRRGLLEDLEKEWERAVRTRASISLILVNLDGFKAYNRAHGYLSGDQTLTELASLFGRLIRRRSDVLARFGGNEFAVLLPDTLKPEAISLAEQLQSSVRAAGIENRSHGSGNLSASIGIHTVTATEDDSFHGLVDGAHQDLRQRRT